MSSSFERKLDGGQHQAQLLPASREPNILRLCAWGFSLRTTVLIGFCGKQKDFSRELKNLQNLIIEVQGTFLCFEVKVTKRSRKQSCGAWILVIVNCLEFGLALS